MLSLALPQLLINEFLLTFNVFIQKLAFLHAHSDKSRKYLVISLVESASAGQSFVGLLVGIDTLEVL